MSEKQQNTAECPAKCSRSKIGGQALIEGVMMKGPHLGVMACRLPNGEIDVETWEIPPKNAWYKKTPFVRGIYSFIISMKDGYRCLMASADKQVMEGADEEEQPQETSSKFEAWLESKFDEKMFNTIMMIGMVLGIVMAVALFFFLPKWIVGLIKPLTSNRIIQSVAEGIVKIVVFVAYMAVTGMSKDIRRTYEYHGAEHKTIACHEAGLPLTVENVRKQIRLHPRCGTSFIFLVLFINILVMCLVPFTIPWQRFLCSMVLLPLTMGVSFESIQFAGRSDSAIAKILSFPGLQIQKITTKEPDDKQIEVAIAAMKPCIPDNPEDEQW
ncbi:MAG: DUF1385 domain-containing protein [Oscillospiraceae bacterium]|nr:DUF1385 domain-containing protein [Oscillospiraceae bacterium]